MSKNINQDIQFEAIKDLLKGCKRTDPKDIDILVLYVISFFAAIGGRVSEHNLLILLRHVGVNLTNEVSQTIIFNLLSYYAGTGIISVIDNGYGLKEMIEDPSTESYNRGQKAPLTELHVEIERIRNELLKRIGHTLEEFNCENG